MADDRYQTLSPFGCYLSDIPLSASLQSHLVGLIDFRLISALCRTASKALGGDNRDRTDDPLLAKQVLSQLSYTPMLLGCKCSFAHPCAQ